jgi:hypothetical protein
MAKGRCRSSSSIGRERSLQNQFLDSPLRLWHGVAGQQGYIHPLDANGPHIRDADETQGLTQVGLDKTSRSPRAFHKNAGRGQNQDSSYPAPDRGRRS